MCKFNLIKKNLFLLFLFGFFAESRGMKEGLEIKKFYRIDENSGIPKEGVVHLFKCLLIGDKEVGKTQILNKFKGESINDKYIKTIGIDFSLVNYGFFYDKENVYTRFKIWDNSGDKRFRNYINSYCKDVHIVFLVYDVTNKKSFENIENWLNHARANVPEGAKFVLIGNKIDLENTKGVSTEEGKNFADDNKMEFIEVSAKTGKNLAYTEEEKGMAANNNGLENILKEFVEEYFNKQGIAQLKTNTVVVHGENDDNC